MKTSTEIASAATLIGEEKAVEYLVETDERLPDIVLDDGEFRLNGREIFVHVSLRVISKDIAAKMPWIQLS